MTWRQKEDVCIPLPTGCMCGRDTVPYIRAIPLSSPLLHLSVFSEAVSFGSLSTCDRVFNVLRLHAIHQTTQDILETD